MLTSYRAGGGRTSRNELSNLRQQVADLESQLSRMLVQQASAQAAVPEQECDLDKLKEVIAANKRIAASHLECYCELKSLMVRCMFEDRGLGALYEKLLGIQRCKWMISCAHVLYAELCKAECEIGDGDLYIEQCQHYIQQHLMTVDMSILGNEVPVWIQKISGIVPD